MQQTITITFGDRAENHVGMQKIGELAENGFSPEDLEKVRVLMEEKGCECELIKLSPEYDASAQVLVIRNAVNSLLSGKADDLFEELKSLDYDKKAKMYGRVVNKKARYNLCLGDNAQEPDYMEGKGRIIAYESVPLTNSIRNILHEVLPCENLMGELNNYQDITKMGIGFHGDAERLKVVAVRLGATLPLHYQWYYKGNPIGERIIIPLHHGDMYIMSEKATGNDWKKKNIRTLRHATGCNKFIA